MADIIQFRRGDAAAWVSANTVLAVGEIGFETDTTKLKLGDGVTSWNTLLYYNGAFDVENDLTPSLGGPLDTNDKTIDGSSYKQAPDQATGVIDYSLGDMVEITAAGDLTLSYTGFVTGNVCAMIVDVVNFGDWTISYPVGTEFSAATAPTFTAGGRDRLLVTKDNADTYTITVIAQAISVVI